MYLKGYSIATYNNSEHYVLPKWDYGGDKPWTNRSWNSSLSAVREIQESDYPLFITDLDNPAMPRVEVNDKNALDNWLKSVMK